MRRAAHADGVGGSAGEIDHSTAREGAAIVDAHDDGAAVRGLDPHARPEGKAAMGGGQVAGVEALAARGPAAVEARTVPGRKARAGRMASGSGGDGLRRGGPGDIQVGEEGIDFHPVVEAGEGGGGGEGESGREACGQES